MKAEDTVLPYLKVSNQIPMTLLEFIAKLEEQARISFKAGEQTQRDRQSVVETEAYFRGRSTGLEASKEERQAGVREVVERYKEDNPVSYNKHRTYWNNLKKEWGLK